MLTSPFTEQLITTTGLQMYDVQLPDGSVRLAVSSDVAFIYMQRGGIVLPRSPHATNIQASEAARSAAITASRVSVRSTDGSEPAVGAAQATQCGG